MPGVLDEYRAQLQAVEEVKTRLADVDGLLRTLTTEAQALAHDPALRQLLTDEQAWLARAEAVVREVRQFREHEARRFAHARWRRWMTVLLPVVLTALAAWAGYLWAAHAYEAEWADLHQRAAYGDAVAARVEQMTPEEHRRFDALMTPHPGGRR